MTNQVTVTEKTDYMQDTPDEEEVSVKYYEEKYELVTRTAFLCGVPDKYFMPDNEQHNFLPEVAAKLRYNDRAMIVRDLCMLRTAIEHNYKKINDAMQKEGRSFFGLTDLFPNEALKFLEEKNIRLPVNSRQLTEILGEINRHISDRINNCRDLMPAWINWDFIREMFVMPNGQKREGMLAAASTFYENRSFYPYGVYINWKPYESGNLFANDYKFATSLYSWHNTVFLDVSNLSDVSEEIKGRIYNFLNESGSTVLIVDCENADPYSLCAMFNCIDDAQAAKIDKVILYDDPQAPSGWRFFEQHVNYDVNKIEHKMIQRILDYKSLLDVKLAARVTKEYYRNQVDSFVLVSSDSDFWGMMEEIPDARFLVMLEHRKASRELKKALDECGIFYCYTDDFYTGMDDSLRKQAMFSEFSSFFEKQRFNVRTLFDEVLTSTRIAMDEGEKEQFYNKYLKNLQLTVEKDGEVSISLKK